jgi:hypothetical protein
MLFLQLTGAGGVAGGSTASRPGGLPGCAVREASHRSRGGRYACPLETVSGLEFVRTRGLWPFQGGFGT